MQSLCMAWKRGMSAQLLPEGAVCESVRAHGDSGLTSTVAPQRCSELQIPHSRAPSRTAEWRLCR